MRSTLPALFRPTSAQKKETSPRKQGAFYDLNLTISHNSYRTKILSPHPASNTQTLKPLLGRYNNHRRSLSVNKSSVHEDPEGMPVKNSSYHKLEEINNVKFNFKVVEQFVNEIGLKVKEVPEFHEQVRSEILYLKEREEQNLRELEENYSKRFEDLYEKMSKLRRETNMEQKFFKKQLLCINDELIDCIDIIKGVENQRTTLKNLNF